MATITFGQYPQSEITKDQPLYQILKQTQDWDKKNEIILEGIKYRRMQSDDAIFKYKYTDYEEYLRKPRHYYWENDETYHYFRYEPIQWQVLKCIDHNPKKLLLISDIAIDCQPFEIYEPKVRWKNCTLRSWLNGYGENENRCKSDYTQNCFIGDAFSKEEQEMMAEPIASSRKKDNIQLLPNVIEMIEKHRLPVDLYTCKSSDYAKAMGVWSSISNLYFGNCQWWTEGNNKNNERIICMDVDGKIIPNGVYIHSGVVGVRPIIKVVFPEEIHKMINKDFRIQKNVCGKYDYNDLRSFYLGEKPNTDGLYINDIWSLDYDQLEKNHKYIQWLFPLSEQSQHNPYGPVISEAWAHKISSLFFTNYIIEKSFRLMLNFYGFEMEYRRIINFADDFQEKSKNWITPKNHNFKKITRIINSLLLFQRSYEAEELRKILKQVYKQHKDIIGETTAQHWGIL